MSKFIVKSLLSLAIIIGLLVVMVTVVSNQVAAGVDISSINILTDYVLEFRGMGGIQEIISSDVGLMFIVYKISDYSHWILTISIIWIVIFLYLLSTMRRSKK